MIKIKDTKWKLLFVGHYKNLWKTLKKDEALLGRINLEKVYFTGVNIQRIFFYGEVIVKEELKGDN